jgi:membrane protease YdiL (CAAX protease family)
MVSEVIVLILLVLFLRHRAVRLRQIGLWLPSPLRGWIAAAVVAALFIWFNLTLPLRNEQNLAELSLFHIYNSLIAGIVAGFVEEIFFRGFFMRDWLGRVLASLFKLLSRRCCTDWFIPHGVSVQECSPRK